MPYKNPRCEVCHSRTKQVSRLNEKRIIVKCTKCGHLQYAWKRPRKDETWTKRRNSGRRLKKDG